MKFKISFNKNTIANFFIQHLEKVVFGIFIVIVMAIFYGVIMKRDKMDNTPQDLNNLANSAQRKLEQQGSDRDTPQSLNTPDYKKIADKIAAFNSKKNIDIEPYQYDTAWDKPLFGQKGPRDQPKLYEVQDLRGSAEFGAFKVEVAKSADSTASAGRVAGTGGGTVRARTAGGGGGATTSGSEIVGKCWVVLTGLVPIDEQTTAYKRTFRDAVSYDPASDVPVYRGYWVDRAEITSPNDVKNPKWTKTFVSSVAEKEARKEWTQQRADVVLDRYIDPTLTFPLGPLVNRPWDRSVAHEPEIPLASSTAAVKNNAPVETPAPEGEEVAPEKNDAENPFADQTTAQPETEVTSRPMQHGPSRPGANTPASSNQDKTIKYKLFRFMDFSVEPGKSYIYRVRLALKNPNYGFKTSLLKEAEFAKKPFLETKDKDSVQSKAIFVPNDTQILAKEVKSKSTGEYSGKVFLVKWLKDTGQEVYKDFAVDRGQVLNFNNETGTPAPVPGPESSASQKDVGNTDFITDAVVLDMSGGRKLIGKDKNMSEPGEILLMFVNNKNTLLMIHSELDDMAEIDRFTYDPETSKASEPKSRSSVRPGGRDEQDAERRLMDSGPDSKKKAKPKKP
jgi:hypothetical protein